MSFTQQCRTAIGLGALLLLAMPIAAHAESWEHKKKISFNTTAEGVEIKEDVAQLPLLIRLHSGNFTFSEAKEDGADLRFFAADGKTPLKYHIENFDPTNELANVLVELVTRATRGAAAAVDESGSYDATQVFAYHFAKVDAVTDSTGKNNAKASGLKAVGDGPIGSAVSLGGSARIDIPASPSLNLVTTNGFTFTAWIKLPASGSGVIYEQRDSSSDLTIGVNAGTLYAGSGTGKLSASSALKPGVWQHIAVVGGAGKVTFYIDGNEAGSGALAFANVGGAATLGEGLTADLDEVALASTTRSAAYIKALAASQNADALLAEFAEEEGGGEGISYVGILLGAVTIDGWVVIGLLGVMFLISIYVMVTKTRMVLSALKANQVFLNAFAEKNTELLTPGHEEVAKLAGNLQLKKNSSIYRLYDVGLHEVAKRFAAHAAADRPNNLNGPALDSIRASLDAAMVREGQRLNNGMVLLTIAIAGGPYLGLLGTVVGVMITFAAIAAAGDVNVNAIAPGIAAALVATVAGLAVAIPALFGYNWLSSKIKGVSSDTQVFVDEFMTKSAELHSIL